MSGVRRVLTSADEWVAENRRMPEPPIDTSAEYYRRQAEAVEAAALKIRFEHEREEMLKIARQFRVLEANARKHEGR